jgi:hypothetical protein
MLIQLIAQNPQMIGTIVSRTPSWVWGLFGGLLFLGFSQVIGRTMGLRRVMLTPVAMTALSVWGMVAAFGNSPQFMTVLFVWTATAAAAAALVAPMAPAAGTKYDATRRSFVVPGSWVPLALILGIFLTKYVVGVELAMRPSLANDSQYALVTAVLYGAFSGIFIGRAARLWRLALRPATIALSTATA